MLHLFWFPALYFNSFSKRLISFQYMKINTWNNDKLASEIINFVFCDSFISWSLSTKVGIKFALEISFVNTIKWNNCPVYASSIQSLHRMRTLLPWLFTGVKWGVWSRSVSLFKMFIKVTIEKQKNYEKWQSW